MGLPRRWSFVLVQVISLYSLCIFNFVDTKAAVVSETPHLLQVPRQQHVVDASPDAVSPAPNAPLSVNPNTDDVTPAANPVGDIPASSAVNPKEMPHLLQVRRQQHVASANPDDVSPAPSALSSGNANPNDDLPAPSGPPLGNPNPADAIPNLAASSGTNPKELPHLLQVPRQQHVAGTNPDDVSLASSGSPLGNPNPAGAIPNLAASSGTNPKVLPHLLQVPRQQHVAGTNPYDATPNLAASSGTNLKELPHLLQVPRQQHVAGTNLDDVSLAPSGPPLGNPNPADATTNLAASSGTNPKELPHQLQVPRQQHVAGTNADDVALAPRGPLLGNSNPADATPNLAASSGTNPKELSHLLQVPRQQHVADVSLAPSALPSGNPNPNEGSFASSAPLLGNANPGDDLPAPSGPPLGNPNLADAPLAPSGSPLESANLADAPPSPNAPLLGNPNPAGDQNSVALENIKQMSQQLHVRRHHHVAGPTLSDASPGPSAPSLGNSNLSGDDNSVALQNIKDSLQALTEDIHSLRRFTQKAILKVLSLSKTGFIILTKMLKSGS
ncbi:nascent polypeptide-associated complex subunit alpha, muscle-specific form-like isoform X31 [Anthonomus grandis grandis]|uniref:nascent polypeptide-associated complex subunit alpha, muscle-specific form-like isoform X31 n=1 Tax=Anthonomus grandis grandis TaxID=2921223 RepID=UPI0021661EA9|nr:nascent polypeptide-associated complex subunit alpha, muscle-specific form-like isoform X31 [Anthonomus grandis grandis]